MDAEVLAGGLVATHTTAGGEAWLLHLSRGEGSYPELLPDQAALQLQREMAEAAATLQAHLHWLGFRSGRIDLSSAISAIRSALVEINPEVVVTHWRGSWHPRHVTAHQATLVAVQAVPAVRELLFGENCEDLEGFRPTCYFDISETVETWFRALSAYDLFRRSAAPEWTGIPYDSYYRAAARNRGVEAGVQAAQGFMHALRVHRSLASSPSAFLFGQAVELP
jgi:LmbE family N-acetylglucosaminyl deacetylase